MTVTISEPDPRWASEYAGIEDHLRSVVGDLAVRVDHIGSTSVPGLPAKDVIDVQVTVADETALEEAGSALERSGWQRVSRIVRDHHVPGFPEDVAQWRKALFAPPDGTRKINLHVRMDGRANQRYALLFRDYLRTHPDAASAYAEVKRGLAALAPDTGSYADAKDPACDLIYLAAERWAAETGWAP
ncbi:MAG: GrpB family protein [Actinomycetota bacterium]